MRILTFLYCKLLHLMENVQNRARILHFRLIGVTIGKQCRVHAGVRIAGNVHIGDNVRIGSYTYINTYTSGAIHIGNDVLIGSLSHIVSGHARVEIGDHCIFAPGVYISDSFHDTEHVDILTKHSTIISQAVTIGKNVWLGVDVVVLKGATIGEGSVIGAKALVNRFIGDYSIAIGIPAEVIKIRK